MLNTSGLYLGPSNAVPLQGSYFISASTDGGHFLLRGLDNKVRAFLNVCRHREKRILLPKGEGLSHWRGRLTSLTCGGHDWGYGFDGAHVSPKTFMVNGNACPIEGDHNLHQVPIEDIGGLYWTGNESQLADIRELLQSDLLKESGITHFVPPDYQLHEVWVTHNRFRPDTGMEVFGDISHVLAPSVHGGTLMRFVDPNGLKLDAPEKSRCGNVQKVPFLKTTDTSKMSDAWRYYREAVLEQSGGETPPYGAVWIAHYPDGTTIEHFPYAVVVSRFAPDHHTFGTRNVVEFYFSDEILAFNPDLAVRLLRPIKHSHMKMLNCLQRWILARWT